MPNNWVLRSWAKVTVLQALVRNRYLVIGQEFVVVVHRVQG